MQVMGAYVREAGFTGWLSELIHRPDLALHYGCARLAILIKQHGLDGGISAYNQGAPRRAPGGLYRNQEYVSRVLAAKDRYAPEFAPPRREEREERVGADLSAIDIPGDDRVPPLAGLPEPARDESAEPVKSVDENSPKRKRR